MTIGFRTGVDNDAYIQVNSVDRVTFNDDGLFLPPTVTPSLRIASPTLTAGSTVSIGPRAATAVANPIAIDLGGTYATVAGENPKLVLYSNPTSPSFVYGLGVSPNSLDYISPATHTFYAGGSRRMGISTNGAIDTPAQPHFFGSLGGQTFGIKSINTNTAVGITNSGSSLTVPVAGTYLIHGQQLCNVAGAIYWNIIVNGGVQRYAHLPANTMRDACVTMIMQLTAGSTIQFSISGATASNVWGDPHSACSVYMLG